MELARRHAVAMALILVLLLATGFTAGPQMSEQEAREKADFVPKLGEYYSKPTVETSASYDGATDAWRVVLKEEVSGKSVAHLVVADDTGEVERVKISPKADRLTYPSLSEDEAVKLASADERVQAELSEHGSYDTD